MYYMDCKEIFPSPFNPRIHVRCSSRNQVTQEIHFERVLNFRSFSQSLFFSLYKKFTSPGIDPGSPASQAGFLPLDQMAILEGGVTLQPILQLHSLVSLLTICKLTFLLFAFEIGQYLSMHIRFSNGKFTIKTTPYKSQSL